MEIGNLPKYLAGGVVFAAVFYLVLIEKIQPADLMNLVYMILGALGINRTVTK